MTPEAQLAFIAALVPVITAIGVIVAIVVNKKLNHITVLTNSTLTTANKRIEALEDLVRRLLTEKEDAKLGLPQKPFLDERNEKARIAIDDATTETSAPEPIPVTIVADEPVPVDVIKPAKGVTPK